MTSLASLAWWCSFAILLVAPIAVLRGSYGADWRWLGFGVASYLAGMAVKAFIVLAFEGVGLNFLPAGLAATALGAISAVAELGAALPFLCRRDAIRWPNVLAFGTAAGIFEMLASVPLGWLQAFDETKVVLRPGSLPGAFGWTFLLERGVTIVGHASSRATVRVVAEPLLGARAAGLGAFRFG